MWKSLVVGAMGVWLLAAPFIVPSSLGNVYNNWLVGAIVTNVALLMPFNRKWEMPLAAGAGIWLFMSGFVPSLLRGRSLVANDVAIAAVLIIAALSAAIHLRQDYREGRPVLLD